MYPRVNHAHFGCIAAQRVLLVVALQIVQPVGALLVEHDQALVACPAKADDLALVPLSILRVSERHKQA